MSFRVFPFVFCLVPVLLPAQQAARPDSLRAQGDTLRHHAPLRLEAITVTAAQVPFDVPMSVIRLTPRVISTTPATSAWDLLRLTAGLEIHDQGQGPGFASNASIRGFSSDHSTDMALWIDGVPVNEPVNGHAEGYNDWSLLMPSVISELTVIEGPASALYGNFAMAGVVNVRTRERMKGSEFSLDGGANGRVDGSFLTGLDRDRTGLVIGVRGMRDGGWRPNSEQHLGQFYGRLLQQLSNKSTLDVGMQLYGAGWDSPGFITSDDFAAHRFDQASDRTDGGEKRHAVERASLRVMSGGSSIWRTTVYATQGNWNFFLTVPPEPGAGEGSGSQTQEIDRRNGWGATSALSWASERAELTVGAQGRLDLSDFSRWFTTGRVQDSTDAQVNARQASAALFLQASADLGQHLRVTLGGRYDVVDTRSTPAGDASTSATHGIVSPKLGLLLHLPRAGALYANVSRGFRSTDGAITEPTLPFITEWAYETGLHLELYRVNGTMALFRTDVSNEQSLDPIHITSTSNGRSRRQGVQFSLAGRLSDAARVTGSWTFTDATYLDAVTRDGVSLNGTRIANTAKYVGSAGLEVGPVTAPWMVRLSTNAVGPYTPFAEPGVVLPAYALVHISGQYLVNSTTTIRFGVRNLLNHSYPELRAGGFVSPGQGRAIYAGISSRR